MLLFLKNNILSYLNYTEIQSTTKIINLMKTLDYLNLAHRKEFYLTYSTSPMSDSKHHLDFVQRRILHPLLKP